MFKKLKGYLVALKKTFRSNRYIWLCDRLFLVVSIIFCTLQIQSLTIDYLRFDVIETVTQKAEPIIVPPNFSFCFRIMYLIDARKVVERYPHIRDRIKILTENISIVSSKDLSDVFNHAFGAELVFSYLSTKDIFELSPSIADLLSGCRYLETSSKTSKCDETFFRKFLFNHCICFEFLWYSRPKSQKSLIQFAANDIKISGFQNARFLALYLNLTNFPKVAGMSVLAHASSAIPWNPMDHTFTLAVEDKESKVYGISYIKSIKQSLPYPYRSNCTDYTKLQFPSRQLCLEECLIKPFVATTKSYPRYAIVKKMDHYKIFYSYTARKKYQSLIEELNRECNLVCGPVECYSEEYRLFVVYSPRQVNFFGKQVTLHLYPPDKLASLIKTNPSFTFQYYFASVGGTIGLYFGWSFYSIFLMLIRTLPKFPEKIGKFKLFKRQNKPYTI